VLRRVLTVPLVLLTLTLAACGEDDEPAPAAQEGGTTTEAAPAPAAGGCRTVQPPEPKGEPEEREAPRSPLERGRRYEAVVRTSCGSFTIALDSRDSPRTAGAFAALAEEDFFDGTTFHRVVPEFVIQGGDPNGNGTGGPGFQVVEAPPEDVTYPRYSVAMAKTQTDPAGASGSQFYVVTSDQADAALEKIYALLGRVTEGREVVDRIGAVATDPASQAPLEPVVIEDVAVRPAGGA
jgi:cyclophilin family peptidyl-prolyl cis-trans isomerase